MFTPQGPEAQSSPQCTLEPSQPAWPTSHVLGRCVQGCLELLVSQGPCSLRTWISPYLTRCSLVWGRQLRLVKVIKSSWASVSPCGK